MADENGASADRKPTERVILRLVPAMIEIPADATAEQVEKARAALATKTIRKPRAAPGWEEVARVTASTKVAAVELHAGKPGTAEAIVGTYRAPTVTSWKDGITYAAPPAPLVERTTVE